MESLFTFVAPPDRCGYLPDQLWSLQYEYVAAMTPEEYRQRLLAGWRHFGSMLFRPRCPRCTACRSLRILVDRFHPDRSQRRARKANEDLRLVIGAPSVSDEKLDLYDRYHTFQAGHRGWPAHAPKEPESYLDSFVNNPFPVREWCYYLGDKLLGVGYADDLPGCLSAIYFFYDPEQRDRSLGTFNVLCLIEHARRRRLEHVYLGYYVAGCLSMEYKPRFRPNQLLGTDGQWQDYLP
ncbi:MAG TPA: arginyltransferase [Gemmataceae bacterium]|nr:arginyltransferase [Gemmataceae bacterium]